jgi:hypothetical protein
MFGVRHSCGSPFPGKWAAGRSWRGHFRSGWGGRHGMGGNMMRAGRMLTQGDLRLIALALIAEQPRHGYEIIKVLEDKTVGWYSPSPGIVYPTLTYLEEAGYVTAQAEGAKKLYTITEEGRCGSEGGRGAGARRGGTEEGVSRRGAAPHSTFRLSLRTSVPHFVSSLSMSLA